VDYIQLQFAPGIGQGGVLFSTGRVIGHGYPFVIA
jgi:hypothetical protein